MRFIRRWLAAIALLGSLHAGAAMAQATHSVYLDIDNNAATGCNVVTPAGAVNGVEARLQAQVGGTPPMVTSVTRALCAGGSFGPPQAQAAGYAVGNGNGSGGADVIELSTALAGLGSGGPVRMVAVSEAGGSGDIVSASGLVFPGFGIGNGPVTIPTAGFFALMLLVGGMLWLARRHPGLGSTLAMVLLLGAGTVWAANFITDGQIADWAGVPALANDASGDVGDAQADLVAVYGATEAGNLFARLDVRDAAPAPVNNAPSFTFAGNPPAVNEDAGAQNVAGFAGAINDNDGDTQTPHTFEVLSNSTPGLFAAGPAIAANGTLSYTPAANANGSATISVQLRDAGGTANGGDDTSTAANFTITVNAVNDAPSFTGGADVSVAEDSAAYDAPWATAISAGPANEAGQTLAFTATVTAGGALFSAAPQITPAGNLQFTPAPGAFGEATVQVELQDNGGTANGGDDASAADTLIVTIAGSDNAPVAVADAASVAEDAAASAIDVLSNDTDTDDGPISIVGVTQPAGGTVAITGGGTGLTYQPDADFCGADPFTYTLAPGGSTATVTVTVTCADDAPTAGADAATVNEDAGATPIDVLANDSDAEGDAFTIAGTTSPADGTVVVTGGGTGLTYEPDANFCGTDTFDYTLAPGGASATVTVTVTCVDDPPTAIDDTASVATGSGPTPIDVLANDTDPDGDTILIVSVVQPASGTVVITGGGLGLTYEPGAESCGEITFDYTITGGDVGTVTVTVADAPSATAPHITSDGGCPTATVQFVADGATAPPVATDVDATDPQNDVLTYSISGTDAERFGIDATTGVVTFIGQPDFFAPADADDDNAYEIVVQVSDGALTDTQAITVEVGLPRVEAKYVMALTFNEAANLDVRVIDFYGDLEPGAPYNAVSNAPATAAVGPGGVVTAGAARGFASVDVTSADHEPWNTAVTVSEITTITAPHNSAQSIAASDPFSSFGSNDGRPSTSYYSDLFRISLTAGQTIEVIMDSGDDLDTYLLLANDQGILVAGNDDDDDGVLGVGSRMIYTATATGVYTIEASTFNGLDTGNYAFGVTID